MTDDPKPTAVGEAGARLRALVAERENDWLIWERRIDDAQAERDAYRRNASLAERTRAEAAESKLAALLAAPVVSPPLKVIGQRCARCGSDISFFHPVCFPELKAAALVVTQEGE